MMQAFVDALTVPLTDREKYKGPAPEPPAAESRFLGPDTEENLQRLFKDRDWTDYLPIILPTEERVADMLKGTSHKPDEVIKTLDWPGGKREVTVERVAICAVMAGAKPEYLPVILALANHIPFGNSTSSMANMILVNGPIRDEIGMNYGTNVMGPHNEANSVIGRTYTLMSKTIGGLHSEKTTWSSLGSTMQYNNVCIAENEEALPEGWEPFHVQMGFKPNDSVITVGDRLVLYFQRSDGRAGPPRPYGDGRLHEGSYNGVGHSHYGSDRCRSSQGQPVVLRRKTS